MESSKLWLLNHQDLVKGLVVTILGAILGTVVEVLKVGTEINWRSVLTAAAIAGLSYIIKQLGTDQNGKLGGKL